MNNSFDNVIRRGEEDEVSDIPGETQVDLGVDCEDDYGRIDKVLVVDKRPWNEMILRHDPVTSGIRV